MLNVTNSKFKFQLMVFVTFDYNMVSLLLVLYKWPIFQVVKKGVKLH